MEWMVVFAHASTDYALLPAVVDAPVLGLVFMLMNVALAWQLGRRKADRTGSRWSILSATPARVHVRRTDAH
jgi:hypothetical protein